MSDEPSQPTPDDRAAAPIHDRLRIEVLEASPERVVGRLPVEGNTQPYGLLHGGASVVLAESLGSIGAMLVAPPGHLAMGIEVNATHHRGVREGFVTGTATPVHVGRTLTTWAIEVVDDSGRPVCTARLTCALRAPREERPATSPGDG